MLYILMEKQYHFPTLKMEMGDSKLDKVFITEDLFLNYEMHLKPLTRMLQIYILMTNNLTE